MPSSSETPSTFINSLSIVPYFTRVERQEVKMSRRTFIPLWRPHHQIPYVLRRGSKRSFRGRPDPVRCKSYINKDLGNGRVDDRDVQWYADHFQNTEVAQIPRGKVAQRVGLFNNAKNSHVVVNDVSSAVRKTSSKQIGRLVAPEQFEKHPETACTAESPASVQGGRSHQFVGDKGVANQKYLERQEVFPYTSSDGSERGGRPLHLLTNGVACTSSEPVVDRPVRPTYKSRFFFQRFCSSVSDLAMRQHERMCTPPNHCASYPVPCKTRNEFTLSGVATRILSALPPIYLRDDHHERYDAVAVRLLSESLKRGQLIPGSSSHIFRSFLDCTGGISAVGNPIWENDNACENIFQNDLFENEDTSEAQPVTPELERLFNRTVTETNADGHFELSMYMKSLKYGVSSLMTPSSVDSPPFHSLPPSSDNNHELVVNHNPFFRSECDLERSPSSSESSSNSEGCVEASTPHFEWTLPHVAGGVYDIINGAASKTTNPLLSPSDSRNLFTSKKNI
ncbi:unnamed protein product [Angiostrongylus costaricensis]|uniref:Fork-head domain-containing protein n=1 Tax=Angiostrongylus costaricensis TaxID=334426 RepID=A0A0R3PUN3_ANGCS|nr:unnamed protein product [Angiostrongylus costaricensis]